MDSPSNSLIAGLLFNLHKSYDHMTQQPSYPTSSSESLGQALESYLDFKRADAGSVGERIEAVCDQWLDAKAKCAEKNLKSGVDFKPLSLIPINETIHSKIIGEFLNPKGTHGQKDLFLQCFLNDLEVPAPEEGTWKISIESSRVDIMLWREKPAAVVVIENKSNGAIDQPNQIYRYWHEQMYLWDKKHFSNDETRRSFRIIYMPADGGSKPADHSTIRPGNWSEMINPEEKVPLPCQQYPLNKLMNLWQHQLIDTGKIPSENQRVHTFFQFYKELWLNHE